MRFLLLLLALVASNIFAQNADDLNAADSRELKALSSLSTVASRDGKVLSLALANRRTLKLQDGKSCDNPDECIVYRLQGLSPDRQFFQVEIGRYEWRTVEWISRKTGNRFEVYTEPAQSPDGKWAASANPAECCGTPGIFVWQIRGSRLVKKLDRQPRRYGMYTFDRWMGNRRFRLKNLIEADQTICPGRQLMEIDVFVNYISGKWELDENTGLNNARCQ